MSTRPQAEIPQPWRLVKSPNKPYLALPDKRWTGAWGQKKNRPEMGAVLSRRSFVVSCYLLQRHKHLNDATAVQQRLQRLPNNRTKHSAPIGSFHRTALCGRSHQ